MKISWIIYFKTFLNFELLYISLGPKFVWQILRNFNILSWKLCKYVLPVDASSFRLMIDVSVQLSPAEKTQILNSYQNIFGPLPQWYPVQISKMEQISIMITNTDFLFYFSRVFTAEFYRFLLSLSWVDITLNNVYSHGQVPVEHRRWRHCWKLRFRIEFTKLQNCTKIKFSILSYKVKLTHR
jgi:hypothetical protein